MTQLPVSPFLLRSADPAVHTWPCAISSSNIKHSFLPADLVQVHTGHCPQHWRRQCLPPVEDPAMSAMSQSCTPRMFPYPTLTRWREEFLLPGPLSDFYHLPSTELPTTKASVHRNRKTRDRMVLLKANLIEIKMFHI